VRGVGAPGFSRTARELAAVFTAIYARTTACSQPSIAELPEHNCATTLNARSGIDKSAFRKFRKCWGIRPRGMTNV
jgi:hypothetical protein